MARRALTRTACLAASFAAVGLGVLSIARASDARVDARAPAIQVAASEAGSRFVPLGIGKSVVIDLPRDIKDVLVADPKIANAVVRSSRRVYLIGSAVG